MDGGRMASKEARAFGSDPLFGATNSNPRDRKIGVHLVHDDRARDRSASRVRAPDEGRRATLGRRGEARLRFAARTLYWAEVTAATRRDEAAPRDARAADRVGLASAEGARVRRRAGRGHGGHVKVEA